MSAYIPLKKIIEPYLKSKFNDLPESIKEQVKEADRHTLWDKATPHQRMMLAGRYDFLNDPSREDERTYFDSLAQQLLEIEDDIETWEASNSQSDPLRMKIKEEKLAELQAKYEEIESLYKQPYGNNWADSIKTVKRKPVYDQQKDLIFDVIRKLGHDPLRLPDYKLNPGRDGIKSEIRSNLSDTNLIRSKDHFNRIWERMLRDGSLKYISEA